MLLMLFIFLFGLENDRPLVRVYYLNGKAQNTSSLIHCCLVLSKKKSFDAHFDMASAVFCGWFSWYNTVFTKVYIT